MEVKINREIRNYTESMFFGLSLRQFVFSLLAVGVAVLLYFVLKPYVGTETVSWMCILGAAPFAAMGFVNYNGMTAEQFVWAWLRSEISILQLPMPVPVQDLTLGFQHDRQYLCPSRLQIQNILGAGNGAGNASSEVR